MNDVIRNVPRNPLLLLPVLALLIALTYFAMPDPVNAQDTMPTDAERCQAMEGNRFADLKSAPTHIVKTTFRPAADGKRASCLVEGYVSPVVNFAMMLPASDWNGRYMVRGCGGSCGVVAIDLACAQHLRDGYACLHTDMGHRSTQVDNNWVEGNLQGLVDFGYRATHVTTVAGKAVIRAYYGEDPRYSYFFGCSTGGRQGLIEAQRFPDDFDGIVAIAPASLGPFGSNKAATITDIDRFNVDALGKPILPNRKALIVHRAAVARCDKDDGITDGLIGKPLSCRFKPAELLCKTGDTRNCLTVAQVGVVEKLYSSRGAMPGSEFNWIGNYLRNAALPGEMSKPLFDLGEGRGDPVVIDSMIANNNPDLRPYRDHGGKLMLVHGLSDHSVMPPPTIDYYQMATKTMGGAAETAKFARFFAIPGMDHCSGGQGAYSIDYVNAIVDWVEKKQAPDALRGIRPKPGAPIDYFGIDLPLLDRTKWVAWERDHRAWPGASVAVGVRAPDEPLAPLAQALRTALDTTERTATAAGFPRRNVLNAVLKAMWEALYRANASDDAQVAALASLDTAGLSPLGVEAVLRMRAELALD